MESAIPKELTYLLERISAVGTQVFKIQPQNSTTAGPNQQIRFTLPSNTILDLASIRVLATLNTTGTGARLPAKGMEAMVNSVRIEAGGVTIDGGGLSHYNALVHAIDALKGDKSEHALGHSEMVRDKTVYSGFVHGAGRSGGTPAVGTVPLFGAANEEYDDGFDFAMSRFHGFLSGAPSHLDTGLLPTLELVIETASNTCLSVCSGGTFTEFVGAPGTVNADYTMKNLRLTCQCVALGSGVYDNMLARSIAEREHLDFSWSQYITTSATHSGSTPFHVSTNSLDKVWVAFRPDVALGPPVPVQGYKVSGLKAKASKSLSDPSDGTIVTADADLEVGISQYGGMFDTDKEKYVGSTYNFSVADPNVTCQFNFSGSLTPGFPAKMSEWLAISKKAAGAGCPSTQVIHTLDQYVTNYAVLCHRLCLDDDPHLVSGLDTRGTSMSASLVSTGITGNPNVLIWCQCHSILQIGAQKQFAVVV